MTGFTGITSVVSTVLLRNTIECRRIATVTITISSTTPTGTIARVVKR